MDGKIICVGMQKTGTTTLQQALNLLGYSVRKGTTRGLISILKGDYKKVLSIAKDYEALEDLPWFVIYKELDTRIAGSKFILTMREEESWYKSVSRYMGDLQRPHNEWIYGRGKGILQDNKENTLKVYREHNKEVLDYFKDRPDDLMVLDISNGDGWEKLCAFLGNDVPDMPFPHANKWKDAQSLSTKLRWKFQLSRRRVKNHFMIWYIDLMGYWDKNS